MWLPSIIFAGVGLIMFIINCCLHGVTVLLVLQFFSCMAVPFLVPLLSLLTKREYSPSLSFNLGILILFGVYVERVFDIYTHFPAYDKILHTNFGFIAGAMLYALFLNWKGDRMTSSGVIVTLMLAALGLGGAWELFEYISAMFTLEDPQIWHGAVDAAIEAGQIVSNPLQDTMEDILVTGIGAAAFSILYLVDQCFGGKAFQKFFGVPQARDEWKQASDRLQCEED